MESFTCIDHILKPEMIGKYMHILKHEVMHNQLLINVARKSTKVKFNKVCSVYSINRS